MKSFLIPLLFASFGVIAQAATINVDFNTNPASPALPSPTFTGTAVLGGGTWNGVTTSPTNSLLDSTGVATTVNMTIGGGAFDANNGGNTPLGLANDLLRDYRNVDNGNFTLTLTGLTSNGIYDLVLYAAGDQTTQGSNFSGSGYTGGSTTGFQRDTFELGVNYSQGTVTANSAGTVTITVSPSLRYSVLNGFQISSLPIPEPSAAMLGVLGSAVFFLRRRNG